MDELLTVSSTRRFNKDGLQPDSAVTNSEQEIKPELVPSSVESVVHALRSQPSPDVLDKCLRWLVQHSMPSSSFNVKVPSPKGAQVVHALANEVLPNFWPVIKDDSEADGLRQRYIDCLTSLAGLGALLNRLKALIVTLQNGAKATFAARQRPSESLHTAETIQCLQTLLQGDIFLNTLRHDIKTLIVKPIQRDLAWKELVTWLSSGKAVALASEAISVDQWSTAEEKAAAWIADGSQYAQWLGRNIMAAAAQAPETDAAQTAQLAQLLGRSFSLGYADELVEMALSKGLDGGAEGVSCVRVLVQSLPLMNRRPIVFSTLRVLAKRLAPLPLEQAASFVPGMASLIEKLFMSSEDCVRALQTWLLGENGGGVGQDISVHKAMVAALVSAHSSAQSDSNEDNVGQPSLLTTTLKQMLDQFGSKELMKYAPVLNQEVCAQDFLLLYGQVYRLDKDAAIEVSKSSAYVNTISNRLAASSHRAQVLGMIVGSAVSELADASDKRLKFDLEKVDPDDKDFYFKLLREELRSEDPWTLKNLLEAPKAITTLPRSKPKTVKKPKPKPVEPPKKSLIQVIGGDPEAEDDLPTYAKPDLDPEDSDDDPTLIQRDRPAPPVYILDLLAGLRDDDNYERHRLALAGAADLIRRKTSFGTEVADHAEALAAQLAGLKDAFDMADFQQMRLQGLVAVVVARPARMGPWCAATLFAGDYSMSQRAAILTAMSLAARELAGYREDDAEMTGAAVPNSELFPSQRLPEQTARRWATAADGGAEDAAAVDALSWRLEQAMIKPMALKAADRAAGPDALKVRTFSSRMEVEKRRKRPVTNELAKIVADGFFFPLTGRFKAALQSQGERSAFAAPFLQAHLLRTLALLLHAAGPSAVALLALTAESWALLLFLREAAAAAPPVLEAWLFCCLTLLEINARDPRRLAEDHGAELVAAQVWVERAFERLRGGSEEGDKARVLAAGVLVRLKEIGDKYQRQLLGSLVDS